LFSRTDQDGFGYVFTSASITSLYEQCHKLRKEFSLSYAGKKTLSCILVELQPQESVGSVLYRMQELSLELKLEGGNDIIDDTAVRQYGLSQKNFHDKVIAKLQESQKAQILTAAFLYQGVLVFVKLKPLYPVEEAFVFKVMDKNCVLSDTVYFKNIHELKHVTTKVQAYDPTSKKLQLYRISQDEGTPFNRHYVRVKPESLMQATIAYGNEVMYGVIGSLSLYSLSVYIDSYKPLKRQQHAEVIFAVVGNDGLKTISIKAVVEKIKPVYSGLKLILVFDRVLQEKETLKDFITHRQLEVIRTYKARCEEAKNI
jgi:hypothetical protein